MSKSLTAAVVLLLVMDLSSLDVANKEYPLDLIMFKEDYLINVNFMLQGGKAHTAVCIWYLVRWWAIHDPRQYLLNQ